MKSVAVLLMMLASGLAVSADDAAIDYARDVKSIFRERCYACHGALKQESGLRLDTGLLAKTGGDGGAAIVPGDVAHSPLIERISATDESVRMPPEGKPLTDDQISVLTRWVQSGALSPENEQPEQDPRKHWAFQKPVRPEVPVDRDATVSESAKLNPIDAFINAQHRSNGITAMPATDKATLLRRVCLDLKGLPPTSDELQAFLADESPTAYEEAVDRLLASPQHGERWARHWMDVWRYSDWYGRRSVPDVMNSYPMVWRWRDWIVKSLNEDKPYSQMVVEMLAADELLPADDQNIVATGFLVRSWFKWNYETWKKDLVEHTGKAFLGLTLNCCQCHDHKYDPFAQEEYFRFRAFFEPLELRHDRVPGEADPGPFVKYVYAISYGPINSGMVRVFDEYLDAETFMFSKGDSRLRIEGKPPMTPAAPVVVGGDTLQISQIVLPITAAYPGMKEFVRTEERSKPMAAIAAAETELAAAKAALSGEPAELRDELQAAEAALNVAREEALQQLETDKSNTNSLALQGTQSLVLDAKTGRRALSHTVPELASLADNGTVSYLVQIVQDDHTNFQLALDIAQGATGGYVAFEKGSIKSYQPSGFNEFVAGIYDLAKGQNRFRVQMQLDLSQNQFLLTVISLTDNAVLVNAVPAAVNGWKPQVNGKRGLFIDCRPGTEAIYDALTFTQPDGTKVLAFDFEPPAFSEGQDVVDATAAAGSAPWMMTGYCQAPATSKITSAVSLNPAVQTAVARLKAAQQALRLPVLTIAATEARLSAAQLQLASIQQRIETDTMRYSTGLLAEDRQAEPEVKTRIHAACQSERVATVATAKANLASADQAIAAAEVKIAEVSKQADQAEIDAANKSLQTAQQQRVTAATALNAANAALAMAPGEYTPLSPKYPQITSGRRAALANWIASRDNPLTARVAVNHIWLRHFGQALVETTHDLGRNGSRPTHPELLDWLACELMDSGWSMKHIHRLIVTSQTYRLASMLPQSSGPVSEQFASASALDPDNRLYWRFPAARMQAEVVRDSLLAVAGELDETMGGHEIDHKQGMTSHRRSLYFAHHGEEKMEFLELFDAANACDCYKRTSSVQPQQALALTNSELTKTLSRQLAKRLWSEVEQASGGNESPDAASGNDQEVDTPGSPAAMNRFVKLAFLQVLNREPRENELSASIGFLEQQAGRLTPTDGSTAPFDPNERARENLIHALMNHNDFVTVR